MKLKIKVTKDILEKSKDCKLDCTTTPTNCAIAMAVRDVFPNAYVDLHTMWFDINEVGNFLSPSASLPIAATQFIEVFDQSHACQRVKMPELEFEIDVPEKVIKRINIDELKPLLENHATLELMPS